VSRSGECSGAADVRDARPGQRIAQSPPTLEAKDLDFLVRVEDIADSRGLTLTVPASRPMRGRLSPWAGSALRPRGSGGHTDVPHDQGSRQPVTCVLYLQLARPRRGPHQTRTGDPHPWPGCARTCGRWERTRSPRGHRVEHRPCAGPPPTCPRRSSTSSGLQPFFIHRGRNAPLRKTRTGSASLRHGQPCWRPCWLKFGVSAAVAEFGIDTSVYRLPPTRGRGRGHLLCQAQRAAAGLRSRHRAAAVPRPPSRQKIHLFGMRRCAGAVSATIHGSRTSWRSSTASARPGSRCS
jgi:hypothetical protein